MAAAAPSDVSDGPVLSLINKRLRALRKKHNRILQMEEAISQGKPINKEQEDVLRSKPSVTALIDELEKLRQPLSSAVSEEINLAVQRQQASVSSQPVVTDDSPLEVTDDKPSGEKDQSEHAVVEDLLNLLYFGSLFDVKSQSDFTSTMLTRTHERSCCITYDYVTDDATDLLAERDLDLISTMSGLLVSRPVDSNLPHKNALERCIEHAKLWLTKADQPIESNTDVTYANLRERLHKIMASDYFTTTPEIKGPVEVAAVAAGNYSNFQVPVAVHEEESDEKFQHTDIDVGDLQGDDISDGQPGSVDELPRDVQETGNSSELVTQQEVRPEEEFEQKHADGDAKDQQQYVPRRGYMNQRGGRGVGGRRGYSNGRGGRGDGRGGGSYQNGRSRYYDQSGNYYQRNYYNGRGRGGRGGGQSYNSHGSAQGAPNSNSNSASVGVAL
ncbi:uncharacterized protein LOC111798762 [Cucurbita pepo subsp. pepo]|uniref:uncharacterized protein LOC111798762 n=1 Tax=Cucurbita pepo subsp. pepo TaxID=3664 RepID=UPI000C9D92AC|nr:uncharacterized protein LOC111798762 [Cucurbita pepo subsp. pepo]XP_023537867.1 uncharacterized protein LOC111798762 [Cucurbita pepo subsp. pepo]